MPYSMVGYLPKKMSYTSARRVNEKATKRKPKVCSSFVLIDLNNRIVNAQAGMPRLSANTCFKLVLRMFLIEETESCLGGLMLVTISPPKSPTPSVQSAREILRFEGIKQKERKKFSIL